MTFRRPFDLAQRTAAQRLYQDYRRHLKLIREKFAPTNSEEKVLFRRYHDLVQDFARELLVPDAKVNVRRLNELQEEALQAAMGYQVQRGLRGLYGPD